MFEAGAVILVAIVAVGFLVVGLSLTLIFKGRNLESEISSNRHMRERGITCAVAAARDAECSDCGENHQI